MASFSPQFLDEIRARLSVSSVVGRRVKLIRRGHEYVGLSPFSNERTPSFTVNDDKGFYHCFSTNEHGDVFTFLMKTQNLTFPEAVERLAEEAGLEMPRQSAEEAREVERSTVLRNAVELGCQHFEKALGAPEGRRAAAYLAERGLTAETIKRFRLGYAGTGLKAALTAKKIPEDVLIETRLISPGKDGRDSFDFFRDRVMFPIFDLRGRPVAFGGRVMGEGEPKYLNSPDTPLFHKGQILYGLALARTAAAEKHEIIVAEGYMDVIALAQAGFTHAVAPLGTALTEAQLELLWRLAPEPILCFDGDKAGQRAALRAAERALPLLKPGLSLRFALLPAGKDPDDICRREGPGAMRDLLNAALPLSEVLWRQLLDTYPGDTPERRAALEKAAESRARQIADGTVQNQYVRMFKDRLFQHFRPAFRPGQGTDRAGSGRFGRAGPSRGARFAPPPQSFTPPPQAPISGERMRERILLATLISHPGLFDHVEERLGGMTFSDGRLDSLRQTAVIHIAQNPELDFAVLSAHLSSVGYAAEIATLLHPEVYQHAGFARPTATLDQATAGWDHTFTLCQRAALKADLERAELELVQNPTNEALAIRDALLQQAHAFLAEDD
ncbi:MAG: DNA primase [Rhodospirillaceae bacterium]|nr:MAG: DNA primase [Rhodospirillaceae bacterium]